MESLMESHFRENGHSSFCLWIYGAQRGIIHRENSLFKVSGFSEGSTG